jgi:hypothetical protein
LLRALNEVALTRDVEVEGSVAEKSCLPAVCGVEALESTFGCSGKFRFNSAGVANRNRGLGGVVDYSSVKTNTRDDRSNKVECILDFADGVVILPRLALPLVGIGRTAVPKLLHFLLVIDAKGRCSGGKRSRNRVQRGRCGSESLALSEYSH